MKYASVFVTILITWIAIVFISALSGNTQTTYSLYKLTMIFTMLLFLYGFVRRRQ